MNKLIAKLLYRCYRCGSKFDYEHSGYNYTRPYCHGCKKYKYQIQKEGK